MKELDQAEKRIEKKWQDFELIKPHLFLFEKQSLDRYSPRVFEILQEFKSYIQQNENVSLKDNVVYYFKLDTKSHITNMSHFVVHDENGQLIHYWYGYTPENKVHILAIGVKEGNRLFIGDEEYTK